MKKVILSCIVLTIVFFSCEDRDDNVTTANIRIKNESNVNFNLVEILADSLFYEDVTADSFSEYLEFEEGFEAMPFTIVTDSAEFNFIPEDLQLDPLPIGLYTYEIQINEAGEIELRFKID